MTDVQIVSSQAYKVRDKPAHSHHYGLCCHLRGDMDTWTCSITAALLVLIAKGSASGPRWFRAVWPLSTAGRELPQLCSSSAVASHLHTWPSGLALTDLTLLEHWWSKAWEKTCSHGRAESLPPFLGSKSCLGDIWDDVRPSGHLLGGICVPMTFLPQPHVCLRSRVRVKPGYPESCAVQKGTMCGCSMPWHCQTLALLWSKGGNSSTSL